MVRLVCTQSDPGRDRRADRTIDARGLGGSRLAGSLSLARSGAGQRLEPRQVRTCCRGHVRKLGAGDQVDRAQAWITEVAFQLGVD